MTGLFRCLLCSLFTWASAAAAHAQAGEVDNPHPRKRIEIDKTHQVLRAYENNRIVLQSRVSTGKGRSTPNGHFHVGVKIRMHYSKLYHHAPMPYSVQVDGNVFIHGFTYVPAWPASHGCIRLPLTGDNPAKRFYDWAEEGTPVEIFGQWERPRQK